MDNQDDQVQPDEELSQSKITLNGQEYDEAEVSELFEQGRKTREAETKYNITFDSIMPAYTKANERAKQADQFEQELSEARNQLSTYQQKKEAGTDNQADLTEAREALKKLNVPFREDLDGYIKRDDLDKYYDEREKRSQAVQAVNAEADKLTTEFSGEDGRPKFNKKVALAYAQAYGLPTLTEAYNDMHADALSTWQKNRIDSSKKPGLKTLAETRGNKQPDAVKPTKENSKDMLMEALWGKQE